MRQDSRIMREKGKIYSTAFALLSPAMGGLDEGEARVTADDALDYLTALGERIAPLDADAMARAWARQARLTKPPGSLGRLEEIAVQIAGMTSQERPSVARRAVIVMAADHGVTQEGVSAYPAEVTAQMALNFLRGGAAINAIAGSVGASVTVVDVGIASEVSHPELLARKVARGTANMVVGPAMTQEQARAAMVVGAETLETLADEGLDLVATGEMGIGNTTAASALTAVMTGRSPREVTGRGTGVDDERLAHKVAVIERAIAVNAPDANDPLGTLAQVGGLEIAALAGLIVAAASRRIPVLLDGFIASSAALIACAWRPLAREYLLAGHVSVEPGHQIILDRLSLRPLLNLEMRLGEGTGATLAMAVVDAALRAHDEMATFDEAGVSDR
jgi:nicotinate-nucleotide--dimethylbenzimidazole phosphoribosyltransferase